MLATLSASLCWPMPPRFSSHTFCGFPWRGWAHGSSQNAIRADYLVARISALSWCRFGNTHIASVVSPIFAGWLADGRAIPDGLRHHCGLTASAPFLLPAVRPRNHRHNNKPGLPVVRFGFQCPLDKPGVLGQLHIHHGARHFYPAGKPRLW